MGLLLGDVTMACGTRRYAIYLWLFINPLGDYAGPLYTPTMGALTRRNCICMPTNVALALP